MTISDEVIVPETQNVESIPETQMYEDEHQESVFEAENQVDFEPVTRFHLPTRLDIHEAEHLVHPDEKAGKGIFYT